MTEKMFLEEWSDQGMVKLSKEDCPQKDDDDCKHLLTYLPPTYHLPTTYLGTAVA